MTNTLSQSFTSKGSNSSLFHVALLKKVIHTTEKSQPLLEGLTDDLELNLSPEAMLDCRINKGEQQEILVKWKQLPDFGSS